MGPTNSKKQKPKDTKGTLKRLLGYIEDYKYTFIIVLALCLASNIMALLGPSMAGKAINEVAAGAGKVNFPRVYYYGKWMLIMYVSSSLITLTISFTMMRTSRKIAKLMRKDVFDKLMKLPVKYFDQHQAGDIISRVSYDIDVITTSLATDIVQIMTSIVTVAGSFIMMVVVSPALAMTMIVTIPMAFFYTKHMGKKTRPRFSKRSAMYGRMNGYVEEMFSGQKTILAYAKEDAILDKFDDINGGAAKANYEAEYYGMTIGPTVGFINNLGLSLIAMFGSLLYMKDLITIGQISSFVLYSRKFSGPINEMANVINEIYSALSAAERVFRLLDDEEEPADAEGALEINNVEGQVELKDVSFGYVPDRTIIKDFNFKAEPGKLTAIVGPTGAGKTTIINLLMRFYDVDSGEILLDEHEIKSLTRKSLRHAYAMVLQDTWVFRGTVFENIAYGKENATMEEVIEAAKAAKIHNYVMSLPNGYNTIISEDGGNISKGQKQLLTIARAMLYDSKMLILDEATSNVDTTTEHRIQKAMRTLMQDKTCFVIAHRLSTIQNADNILVVDHGNIVEQGTHPQLMKRRGFYYKLYASQFE